MIDERLDREIEVGAKARPRYKTDVIETDGGATVRNARWRYPLFTFEFNLEPGDPNSNDAESLHEFIDLFHCAGGQHETFRFRHWSDYQARAQPLATGDGVTTDFQLYRVYIRGAVSRRRKITRPVTGTVVGYVNGVESSTTVDLTTGILTFAPAPAAGSTVTADFDFDIPVRFDSDELEMIALSNDLDQPVNIVLVEERE